WCVPIRPRAAQAGVPAPHAPDAAWRKPRAARVAAYCARTHTRGPGKRRSPADKVECPTLDAGLAAASLQHPHPRNIPESRMLDSLTNRLAGVVKTLRGQSRLTEANIQDALREV